MSRQITFEVARHVDPTTVHQALAAVAGVVRVRQVFPGHLDAWLCRIFVLHVESAELDRAFVALQGLGLSERVELAPIRGIRSTV